jgi:hypothetical protein
MRLEIQTAGEIDGVMAFDAALGHNARYHLNR